MSAVTFAREVLRNWKEVGAILPSSRALARRMVEAAGVSNAHRVLELGPGTGAITDEIAAALPSDGHLLGLELNDTFVKQLQRKFPQHQFVSTPAQEFDFDTWLPPGEGFHSIVSGLPWTAFPTQLQRDIIGHVLPRLEPGGRFVTFAYWGLHWLPRGRHFRELLADQPGRLSTTEVVWGNTPPAFVYVIEHVEGE